MRMSGHSLKLLFLLAVFSVSPATAGRWVPSAAARSHSACPHERARAEAAERAWAAAVRAAAAQKGPTNITLTDRSPVDGSLLGLGRGPGFLNP